MSNEDIQVVLEHFDTRIDGIAEVLILMNDTLTGFAKDSDMQEVKEDIKTIKHTITETNLDVRQLTSRVSRLETAILHD
jgi:hypothetical protein